MPASVLPPYQCKCKGCVALNGPAGRTIPGKDRISHLNRVQAELDQEARFLNEDPESAIFSSTLIDDIPVATTKNEQLDPRESRLWSSNDPFSVANLLASLPSYSTSSTSVRSNSKPQSGTTTPDDSDDSEDSEDSVAFRSTSKILKTGIPKEERNILTSKAHQSLDVVEKRIQQCLDKIDTFEASTASPASSIYILEAELSKIQQAFDKVTRTVVSVVNRKKLIKNELNRLHERFESLRNQYAEDPHLQGRPLTFDSSHHFSMPINDYASVSQITMLITIICNVFLGVGRRFGDLILGLHKVLVRQSFIQANQSPTITPAQDDILNQIPNTLDTAIQKFNLGCKTVTYAVCPECNCTYAPRFQPGVPDVPIYPPTCNNRPTPEIICNASLLDDSSSPPTPHKKFRYHSFHDYVASLLARKDLENLMDKACDDLVHDMEAEGTSKPGSSPVRDFFQGQYIRTFKGRDQKLFVKRPKDEGRLCFVFNVDYFNAEGQSIRGPSASIGLISGACLNLPLDIRYKPENMFLAGIIPGPSEPTKTEINHFIRYLVDDLLVSYTRGIHFSRTANHPDGRLVECAASIFINDLPAARQVNGSASYNSHNYCHSCGCVHIMTLPRTDIDADVWRPRKASDLRKLAEAWKDAPTQARREELFTESGYRWTELWRLPYYDPARMLAVDSMHCLLEGLVQYHFRSVLSLTDVSAEAAEQKPVAFDFDFRIPDENWYNANYKPDADGRRHIKQIHKFLLAAIGQEGADDRAISQLFDKLAKRLESKTIASLRFVAESVNPAGARLCKQKADYIKVLLQWRKTYPLRMNFDPALHIKYGTTDTINRIREVILDMDTPSWLRSVPSNFGASAAGSLKADEWRTMATVYIPVALVSLWGEGTTHASAKVSAGLRRALDHTMNLVAAVTLACKGTMTQEIMDAYREELSEWRVNLTRIHPKASHTPNSHMAVHIYEYLQLFGPVRSWWCFPFERMIGQLQRLGSNHKYGDLEITLAESYRKAAKLRQWFQRPDCPDFLKDCQKILYREFPSTTMEGQEYSIPQSAFRPVPKEFETVLKGYSEVAFRAHYRLKDVIYSRASTHVGNSLIIFFSNGRVRSDPVLGSIEHIIVLQNFSVFYLVRRQLPVDPASVVNPFSDYPYFDAHILSPELSNSLEIVQPEWVLGHYARWEMDRQRVVALPLYKRT